MTVRAPSLRRRLVVGVVGVLALGVVGFGTTTYIALRVFLDHRSNADALATVRAASVAVAVTLHDTNVAAFDPAQEDRLRHALSLALPSGGVAALHLLGGVDITTYAPHQLAPQPAIDRMLGSLPPLDVDGNAPASVGSKAQHVPYRVAVENMRLQPVTVIAAIPTVDAATTLHRLLVVDTVTGVVLLVALALGSLVVVRRGLRPLDVIASTAGAITAGARHRRMPVAEGSSEVGRVSAALNHMLAENEVAFAGKEASEARLRRFLADASHELRTPLASVRGYAELIASGAAETADEQALALDRIRAEATRMSGLVEDLLLLARLDMGRPLRQVAVDLSQIAVDAVSDLRAVDPSRPVTVETAGPVVIEGDADRLRQVLANLLSNARMHTPPGSPVAVSVTVDGASARIRVADSGPGIPAEAAGRVFDPFYRGDPARSRRDEAGSGVGLGLAVVDAIVHAHGGTVAVDRGPAGGAVFDVRLPLRSAATPPAAAPAADPAGAAPVPADR